MWIDDCWPFSLGSIDRKYLTFSDRVFASAPRSMLIGFQCLPRNRRIRLVVQSVARMSGIPGWTAPVIFDFPSMSLDASLEMISAVICEMHDSSTIHSMGTQSKQKYTWCNRTANPFLTQKSAITDFMPNLSTVPTLKGWLVLHSIPKSTVGVDSGRSIPR